MPRLTLPVGERLSSRIDRRASRLTRAGRSALPVNRPPGAYGFTGESPERNLDGRTISASRPQEFIIPAAGEFFIADRVVEAAFIAGGLTRDGWLGSGCPGEHIGRRFCCTRTILTERDRHSDKLRDALA